MIKEVKTLENLNHPNIIEYKHTWLEYYQLSIFGPSVPCLFILMTYANGGNLEEFIINWKNQNYKNQNYLPLDYIQSFFMNICDGLNYLHSKNIIHRDIKPMNLLLVYKTENCSEIPTVLLTDFGECEQIDHITELEQRTGATGTLDFTAPELLKVDRNGNFTSKYSTKSDVWSLGIVLFYICFSKLPFKNVDIDTLTKEILKFDINMILKNEDRHLPNIIKNTIIKLLSKNPQKRPSTSEIMQLINCFQTDNNNSRTCIENIKMIRGPVKNKIEKFGITILSTAKNALSMKIQLNIIQLTSITFKVALLVSNYYNFKNSFKIMMFVSIVLDFSVCIFIFQIVQACSLIALYYLLQK